MRRAEEDCINFITKDCSLDQMNLKQAVILCGGLGTRLMPLTEHVPKPMVKVNGRPFLLYLIEQLKANGITNILLLTGYKKEAIEEFFGDGSSFGVSISYSHGDIDWDTGKRLYQARNQIDDHFFLMYSDNFVQYNLEKLKIFYLEKKKLATFAVFSRKEKNNIELRDDGLVLQYDKTRTGENLGFVELGCMVLDKKIFSLFDDSNFSFSKILKELTDDKQLVGYIIIDPYYSISDPEKLELTKEYLRPKKILLLDRDGVINKKAPKSEYICTKEEFEFLPDVIDSLKLLSDNGYSFVIISNQAGIARGKYTMENLHDIHKMMLDTFEKNGIKIHKVYVCPHHWDEGCACRKPKPGMLLQASKDFMLRLDDTYFFGDDDRDILAAYNSNAKSILIGDTYDKERLADYPCSPDFFAQTIKDAADYILQKEKTK